MSGSQTATDQAAAYRAEDYPRPSVTCDVVILTLVEGDLRVLLVKRRNWPFEGMWAIPGGFLNMDEGLEDGLEVAGRQAVALRNGLGRNRPVTGVERDVHHRRDRQQSLARQERHG